MKYPSLALAAALLTGCVGYTIGPVKPTRMAGINVIAVPTFESNVIEPRVEVMAADAVIKQIQQDGTYKVGRVDESDAILEGTVKSIVRQASRSVSENVLATSEFTLRVTYQFTVKDEQTGEVLMNGTVNGETSFFVSGDVNQEERQALPLAFEEAAVRLVAQISEGF